MTHIEDLHIQQFRGVRDLKLTGLGQFNLLVGGNNSGKTTVLEAVDLHCHPLDILELISMAKRRDSESVPLPRLDSVQWMFPTSNTHSKMRDIVISSSSKSKQAKSTVIVRETQVMAEVRREGDGSSMTSPLIAEIALDMAKMGYNLEEFFLFLKQREQMRNTMIALDERGIRAFEITMEYSVNGELNQKTQTITNYSTVHRTEISAPTITTQLVTPVDHRSLPISSEALTQSILSGKQEKILDLIRLFDPDIIGIQILTPDGRIPAPYIHHRVLGHTPVSVFGDGVRRALTLASAVLNCRDGILLIDEIETAVYVKALDKVFTWLVDACKTYNVQLIATTHSLEAVDAVLAAMDATSLVTYKLEHKNNTTVAKRFSGEELHDIRYEFGLDVR